MLNCDMQNCILNKDKFFSVHACLLMLIGEIKIGNTDKFEMIANIYDTPERI